jgi:DNA-binding MarR family transcriptional regulator
MQTFTLVLTDPDELQPMNNLCSVFCCDASNVTGIIDGLEQKNLVSRQSHSQDRRIKVVQIEPEGAKVRDQIMRCLTQRNGELFGALTDVEVKQLASLLQKLA